MVRQPLPRPRVRRLHGRRCGHCAIVEELFQGAPSAKSLESGGVGDEVPHEQAVPVELGPVLPNGRVEIENAALDEAQQADRDDTLRPGEDQ